MHTFDNPTDRPTRSRTRRVASLLCTLVLAQGCTARVDLKRMAYETLRREDCRLNQLDTFCQRTFANEYAEYEQLRRKFIRDVAEGAGRTDTAEGAR